MTAGGAACSLARRGVLVRVDRRLAGEGGAEPEYAVNRPLIIAVIGVVVVAIAIGLNFVVPWSTDTPDKASAPPEAVTTPPGEAAVTGPAAPVFDVVRVSPRGDTVIAGRAVPGSTVVIKDNGDELGRVVADERGEWVFVPEKPLAEGDRQLSLEMHVEGSEPVPSDTVVVLTVPEGAEQALAVQVPRQGSGPTTVMQMPVAGEEAGETFKLTVDAVDYDDAGRLSISGRAAPGAVLQVYLDNRFIGKAKAGEDGHWIHTPDAVAPPGLYTLRADHVDDLGKVLARVAFPFARAEPLTAMREGTFVVVQPGNSLWRLARRVYGSGFRYTVIYGANKDQIGDPDLIYPGQVFVLPANNAKN